MRRTLQFAIVATATALIAAPAFAASTLPDAVGKVTFAGDLSSSCNRTLSALGSASCSAPVEYFTGPDVHVTGNANGSGATTAAAFSANPTATASLAVSGGDEGTGAGFAAVTTELRYYVTVIPITDVPILGLKIPLAYSDAGSIAGAASSTNFVEGFARTDLHAFEGDLIIDGSQSSVGDEAEQTTIDGGGTIAGSYGGDHSVVFDFSEGDAIAEVDLMALCEFGSNIAGFGTVTCAASADPFFGFDQAAFDAQMGPHTFNLADAFKIEVSTGLESAPAGVPEPAAWALMIAGFGLAGASLRRRRARAGATS